MSNMRELAPGQVWAWSMKHDARYVILLVSHVRDQRWNVLVVYSERLGDPSLVGTVLIENLCAIANGTSPRWRRLV